uniref:Ig-like domain-containing protein n=1 Tax=Knipowitschia caucasica TaxID=637954 RepID=A0AAV2KNZ2_KNICA
MDASLCSRWSIWFCVVFCKVTTDAASTESLSVSPDRTQHFTDDIISLSCGFNSTGAEYKRYSDNKLSAQTCSSMRKDKCDFSLHEKTSAVFWCESRTGEMSNAINISAHTAPVSKTGLSSVPVMWVVGPVCSVVLLILLLLLWSCTKTKGQDSASENVEGGESPEQQQLYSSLLHADVCVYETLCAASNTNGEKSLDSTI